MFFVIAPELSLNFGLPLKIFIKKVETQEEKAKIQGIDLNEFVHAVPHDSGIINVEYGLLEEDNGN